MKIISWNVNGLRSHLKKIYLDELLINEDPDIFCMTETKLNNLKNINVENLIKEKYNQYKYIYFHNSKDKTGYSGSSIFSKKKPLNIIYGLDYNNNDIDNEGRVITIEFKKYYIINVYTPNSGEALNRLEWRIKIWDIYFKNYINKLQQTKSVIICGDLNVANNEIDIKNPKNNLKSAGFTIEERNSFKLLLTECELLDIYRKLYPDKIEYTYWSYKQKCRYKNIGWRIDYFLISKNIEDKVEDISILTNILGSDHAPIKLIIK